jgi:putative membrane protein
MKQQIYAGWIAAGALLAVPGLVAAQAQPKSEDKQAQPRSGAAERVRTPEGGKLTGFERQFIIKTAQNNMAEIELGRTGVEKASNSDVKQFAQKLVDDHSKVLDELKSLASSKGIDLPSDVTAKHKSDKEHLMKYSGAEFDKNFMSHMVKAHQAGVSDFRQTSKKATDPDVKSLVDKTLPTLEQHLEMARETASKVGGSATGSAARSKTK